MAACDRNVISAVVLQQPDWRGAPPLSPTDADAPTPGGGASRGRTSSIPPGSFDPLMRDVPLDSASPTPKHVTPEQSPAPSRAASRARSPIGGGGGAAGGTSPFASPHSSRVSTPHMPPTTLYANFHALQSVGALNSPTSSASRSLPPRSQSRRRPADPHYSETTPHHGWLGIAPDSPAAAQVPPPAPSAASMSRRSSGVASLGTSLGLLSPDLIPFGRGSSPAPSHPPPSSSSHQALPPFTPNQVNAQLVKLETELVVLQGEVNFQNYLKQLHLQHMGTLHREKVLESGAEAERQSSVSQLCCGGGWFADTDPLSLSICSSARSERSEHSSARLRTRSIRSARSKQRPRRIGRRTLPTCAINWRACESSGCAGSTKSEFSGPSWTIGKTAARRSLASSNKRAQSECRRVPGGTIGP